MTDTIKIDTAWFENGLIEQSVFDHSRLVSRQIMNTQEGHVRRALMALGWTPPSGMKALRR